MSATGEEETTSQTKKTPLTESHQMSMGLFVLISRTLATRIVIVSSVLLVSTSDLRGCIPALASSIATARLGLGIVVISVSSSVRLSVTVVSIVVVVVMIGVAVVVGSLVVSGCSSAAIVVVARLTVSAGLVLGSIVGIVVLVLHREGGIGTVRRFGSSRFGGLVIHVMQAHCIVLVRARVIRVCIIVSANLGLEIPRWLVN